jgi:hypothetical protein
VPFGIGCHLRESTAENDVRCQQNSPLHGGSLSLTVISVTQ